MSHISSTVATTSSVTLSNKNIMLTKEHRYEQRLAALRPPYEAGYDEANSFGIDLATGEVKIVRPLPAISTERGFRSGF